MNKKAVLLIRFGLAFSLAYYAVAGFLAPSVWVTYAPVWIINNISAPIFVIILGVIEIAIAVLVLFTKRPFYPSIVAALIFGAIVIFNLGQIDIVFRDISLFFVALSLATLSK